MQKTIFSVFGVANSGKTLALRAMCSKLINDGAKIFSFNAYCPVWQLSLADLNNKSILGDIEVLLIYKDIHIGIFSCGDPGYDDEILKHIKDFQKTSCELILCATRTRGATKQAVKENSNGYEVKWFAEKEGDFIDHNKLWNEIQSIIS